MIAGVPDATTLDQFMTWSERLKEAAGKPTCTLGDGAAGVENTLGILQVIAWVQHNTVAKPGVPLMQIAVRTR